MVHVTRRTKTAALGCFAALAWDASSPPAASRASDRLHPRGSNPGFVFAGGPAAAARRTSLRGAAPPTRCLGSRKPALVGGVGGEGGSGAQGGGDGDQSGGGVVLPALLAFATAAFLTVGLNFPPREPPPATAAAPAQQERRASPSEESGIRLPDWQSLIRPEWRSALRADEKAAWRRVPRAVVKRLRGIAADLSDLQADIYAEDWETMAVYPNLMQAYLPLFTRYTDSAFPSDSAVDASLRFSLRYEVGELYRHVRELEAAVQDRSLPRTEQAFAKMSLSYDRYLKAGDLYEGYDPVTDTTTALGSMLKLVDYEPPLLDPPAVRDDVVVLLGPDKGKTGRVLWIASIDKKPKFAIVRLSYSAAIGDAEVKTFDYSWIARTSSSGNALVKDIVCGFAASVIACTIVYPIDSFKVRLQSGKPGVPTAKEGGPPALFNGLLLNLGREAPNASILLGTFNYLKRAFLTSVLVLPVFGSLNSAAYLRFLVMVPAGAIADALGSTVRVPFELLNKQVQAGKAKDFKGASEIVFGGPNATQLYFASWTAILVRDVPYGTLQLVFFELLKEVTPAVLDPLGFSVFAQRLVWGFFAGAGAGILTVPVDNISTVVMTDLQDRPGALTEGNVLDLVKAVAVDIWERRGAEGFLVGAGERALYYAPQACLFFTCYDTFVNTF